MKNNLTIPKELILDMNENLPGNVTIADLQKLFQGKQLRVPYKLNTALMESPIENAELSVRATNSLKRMGYHTVGQVIDTVSSFDELRNIKGCGDTTVKEIKVKFFFFQYSIIEDSRKKAYLQEVLKLNGIR